jgi:hypothetical protein
MEVRSDRRFRFAVSRQHLWDVLCDVDQYPTWWPWLRGFDGTRLSSGERWRCVVQPPLPYRLAFDVALRDVEPASLVTAGVSGDIIGAARLELSDHPSGCEVRLESRLSPRNAVLRGVAAMAAPVARYGHDWVLDTGARHVTRILAG